MLNATQEWLFLSTFNNGTRNILVSTAIRLQILMLVKRGSNPLKGKSVFYFMYLPDWLWEPIKKPMKIKPKVLSRD
jgi:hypothetical protein